jgi:2-amino-4-hydroxy-6-hydroxymethyldihydropteridine diphosphokinase
VSAEAGTNTDVAWIGLGSNLGHRGRALARLRHELQAEGVVVEAASSEILTRAHGVTAQEDFHNQVLRLRAPDPWSPQRWLAHLQAAETRAGRRETYRWGPRVADADILLLGRNGDIRVATDDLTVPHRELRNREYLQRLLREIGAPESALALYG